MGHRSLALPFRGQEEFLIEAEANLHGLKPRWGQVRVSLTVWDAVLLQIAPESFLGQTWIPELGTAIANNPTELRLPLMKPSSYPSDTTHFLLLTARWRWSHDAESGIGKLVIGRISLGDTAFDVYVEVKIFQETDERAIEALDEDESKISIPVPTKKYRRTHVTEPPNRASSKKSKQVKRNEKFLHPPKRTKQLSFVVAGHLANLGRRLRFAGVDTLIVNCQADARKSVKEEGRIMIVLPNKHDQYTKGAFVVDKATPQFSVDDQVRQILGHFGVLIDLSHVASRCVQQFTADSDK